jgi:hypothetical protein
MTFSTVSSLNGQSTAPKKQESPPASMSAGFLVGVPPEGGVA